MKPYIMEDEQKSKYEITRPNGTFVVRKIVADNKYAEPSKSEMRYVIKKLKKDLTNPLFMSNNDILSILKKGIDMGSIINITEIDKILEDFSLSQEDRLYLQNCLTVYLASKNKGLSESIQESKNQIIKNFNKTKTNNSSVIVSFDIVEIKNDKICQFLMKQDFGESTITLEEESFYYDEELKQDFIEPILEEIVSKGKITSIERRKAVNASDDSSVLHLLLNENNIVHLNNIEYSYANYLEGKLIELDNKEKNTIELNNLDVDLNIELEKVNEEIIRRRVPQKNKGSISNSFLAIIIGIITGTILTLQILFFS